MKKLIIAVPNRDDFYGEHVASLCRLVTESCQCNVFPFFLNVQSTYIDQGRNAIAQTVFHSDYDYWMSLDTDVALLNSREDNIIKRLIESDKDFVSGIYVNRKFPHHPQIYKMNEGETFDAILDYPEDKPFEVDAVGAGFIFMKKVVLDTFTPEVIEKNGLPFNFLNYATPKHQGEDMAFCTRVKKNGIKIWADPFIKLIHFGKQGYTTEDFKIVKEAAEQNEVSNERAN